MDEEIDFLLLNPFADIVEKAQVALEAAQDVGNDEMTKAAQALLKEGERARKAIEPIAKRHLALYGENFVTALKDHDGIAEHIDALNDLIYVFDDYTEPDSFDADKFKELGKTAQQTTLRITPILRRMKLEAPAPPLPSTSPLFGNPSLAGISRVNSVISVGGHSTGSYTSSVTARSPRPDDVDVTLAGTPIPVPSIPRYDTVVHDPLTQQQQAQQQTEDAPIMGILGGPDLGWNNGQQPPTSNPSPSPTSNPANSPILTRQSMTPLPSIPEPPTIPESPPPPPPPSIPNPPPPVPPINPWQLGSRPSVAIIAEGDESEGHTNDPNGVNGTNGTNGRLGGIDIPERRRRLSTRPDSPTLPSPTNATTPASPGHFFVPPPPPPTSSYSPFPPQSQSIPRRLDDGVDAWQKQQQQQQQQQQHADYEGRMRSLSSNSSVVWPLPPQHQQQPPQQRQSAPLPTSAPASNNPNNGVNNGANNGVNNVHNGLDLGLGRMSRITGKTGSTASSTNDSVFSYDSIYDSFNNQARDSYLDPISPVAGPAGPAPTLSPSSPAGGNHAELLASFASRPAAQSPPVPPVPVAPPQRQRLGPEEQPGLEIIPPAVDIDPGLIPVDSPILEQAAGKQEQVARIRPADCNIGPGSSYHLLKGFCEGAKEVQRGNIGVRKIKKLSYSGAGAEAAKCTSCFFELKWAEVDKDWQNHPSVNYRMHGIGFRLRFLSKCHLPAKQVDDPLYACIFCLQEGHTLEESDATVFFSQGQLFSHLARHPRPLPNVQGITVIDGPEIPEQFKNNYDLHFAMPPVHSELDGIRRELQQLPTAMAVETFRKAHGALRRPPDGAVPIQFPIGSKIVGIEFPAKYRGEWAVGWFDNVRGPFPVEHIRLEPPPRNEIRTQGTSGMRATARWKWASSSVYRNSDWLRLDRNETVSNIVWAHPDHWCWAGTNAKGKWGYFPQSHIEPNSLRDGGTPAGSDAASVVSQERSVGGSGSGTGGLLARFRSHNNHSTAQSIKRPVSIASHSTSSSR
ncbi:hypothetical protein SEUCBS139899_009674 [Sporothrix eucalyptigena]